MPPTNESTTSEQHGVEVAIAAPPESVYELLADITRMGEWSPECVRCRWIGAASAAVPGARFRGTSRNGWRRWSTVSTIVTADAGRRLAFDVSYFRLPVARWRYELRPDDRGGTVVTEAVDDRRGRLLRALSPMITGSRDRGRRNEETMRTTLERLKTAAEPA